MKRVKHAVVLVNFKTAMDTIECINSIKKTKDTPHIIVVDNGSNSQVIGDLKSTFPDLDLLESPDNLGFSAANNLGIKKALKMGAKVVYILNNDTTVDPNLFFRSYRFVEGKNRIAGAKIYYSKGHEYHVAQQGRGNILWYAGGYVDWESVIARHIGVDEEDKGQYDKVKAVDFITGCFMAIPRPVFKKIGFFNESLFLYLEDVDLCLQAKKMGVDVMYNPHLVVHHKNSSATVAGSPLVDYYITRNRFYVGNKYGSIKLKFSLIKEALLRNWTSSIRRAAFIDYQLGHMGNRNKIVYNIAKQK